MAFFDRYLSMHGLISSRCLFSVDISVDIISNLEAILFGWKIRSRCQAYTSVLSYSLRVQVLSSFRIGGTWTRGFFIHLVAFHNELSVLSVVDKLLRYDLNVLFLTSLILPRRILLIRFHSVLYFGCRVKWRQVLLAFRFCWTSSLIFSG